MKAPKILCSIAALAFSLTASHAVETDPVGFVSVTVPANSDAVLAVPLNRSSEFKGVISSIAGNVITVTGTPGWTANQFVQSLPGQIKTYAVQIASGVREGLTAKITANTTNTLTIQLPTGDNLTGVVSGASGDQIDVLPYWTPASLFSTITDGTELYTFVGSNGLPAAGTYAAPSMLYVYDTISGGWIDQLLETAVNHDALNFGSAILVRNNGASSLTLSMVGSVPMSKHRFVFGTQAGATEQDVRIGFSSPVPELLSSVGLPAVEGDQLLAFNNAASGKNKAPASILVYDGTQWLDSGTELAVPTFQLLPGNGYIFRKAATVGASNVVWTDLQSYLAP